MQLHDKENPQDLAFLIEKMKEVIVKMQNICITSFLNLFCVSTCYMKMRPYLVNCKETDIFTNELLMKKHCKIKL